jgi:acyl carrier protein
VSQLGERAAADGKQLVEFTYRRTDKNLPALKFITSIGDKYRNETGTSWTFPAEILASVKYEPEKNAPFGPEADGTAGAERPASRQALAFGVADRSGRLQQIGESLCDIDRIARAIEKNRVRNQPLDVRPALTQGSALEVALMKIWRMVLGKPRIGMNDNFFEAGGTSLRAVQVIAMIKKELNRTLSIVSLFECPTVALLAAKLSTRSSDGQGAPTTAAAAAAGSAETVQRPETKSLLRWTSER